MSKFLMNIQQKFSNATKYINISIFLLTFLIGIIYIYTLHLINFRLDLIKISFLFNFFHPFYLIIYIHYFI